MGYVRATSKVAIRTLLCGVSMAFVGCATHTPISASLLNAAQSQVVASNLIAADSESAWRADLNTLGENSTLYLRPGTVLRVHGSSIAARAALTGRSDALPLQFEYRWSTPQPTEDEALPSKVDSDFIAFLLARANPSTESGDATPDEIRKAIEVLSGPDLVEVGRTVRRAIQTLSITTLGKHVQDGRVEGPGATVVAANQTAAEAKQGLFGSNDARTAALTAELSPWQERRYLSALCSLAVIQGNSSNQGTQRITFRIPMGTGRGDVRVTSVFEAWPSAATPPQPADRRTDPVASAVVPSKAAIPWTRLEVLAPIYINDAIQPIYVPSCSTLGQIEQEFKVKIRAIERLRVHAACTGHRQVPGVLRDLGQAISWQCAQLDDYAAKNKSSIYRVAIRGRSTWDFSSGLILAPEKIPIAWIAPHDRLLVERTSPAN